MLTATQVREQTGATYRQLNEWAHARLITPVPVDDPDTDWRYLWPPAEVAVVGRMVRLTLVGLVPSRAAAVARLPGVEVEVAAGVYVRVDGDTGDTGGGS